MKKRKELNALIGLGENKRKKTKKGSGHRLLRTEPPGTESESSSDDDEFNNLGTVAAFGKRSYTQCCNICYPLFLFIILAACVMACAGLIWMQIALKEDLDSLKEKLRTMESSQKVSLHEIPKLSEDLKTKQRKLEDIESGDKGLNKLWFNLTEMNRKISLLDSAVNHLKANIKSASDLINLPTTVEELQKSVATIGSTLTSVQHDVKTMQTALEERDKEKQHSEQTTVAGRAEADPAALRPPDLLQDVVDLRETVGEVNQTLELHHSWSHEQIVTLRSAVSNLTQRLSAVERGSALANPIDSVELLQAVEGKAADAPVKMSHDDPGEATTDGKSASSPAPKVTRRPRFLTPNRSKRDTGTGNPKTFSLPGVSSLKDLEDFFQHAGFGATSRGMSFHQLKKHLKKVFGIPAPDARALERYDRDRDGMYSLTELAAAVSL